MARPNQALIRFVDRLIQTKFRTATALAAEVGMSSSALSRGVQDEGTLSVENCLSLAMAAGEHPSKVLRLARRKRAAELLELAYGPTGQINQDELELVETWRHIDEQTRDAIRVVMQTTLELSRRTRASAARSSGTAHETRPRKRRRYAVLPQAHAGLPTKHVPK